MFDRIIIEFDKGLRAMSGIAVAARPRPDAGIAEAELDAEQRRHLAGLMRVNHCGEVCAQALYQGQALTARDPAIRTAFDSAAREETDHLDWCAGRVEELGGHLSLLNPLWYAGSLLIGTAAGVLGDRWSLGFLAETERQVEAHLAGHMSRLPPEDKRTQAIVEQMKIDESRHADLAMSSGARELPEPVKAAMRIASGVMTRVAYWI
jgi:ubiquinone biosynthesis monooxygenase Coq7